MYNAEAPIVNFHIEPIDAQSNYRSPFVLMEHYAGIFGASKIDIQPDDATEASNDTSGLNAAEWDNEKAVVFPADAFDVRYFDFVRMTRNNRVFRGRVAARECSPNAEMCGLTCKLRVNRHWNKVQVGEGSHDYVPRSPKDAPVLMWKAKQGDWQTVKPADAQTVTLVKLRDVLPEVTTRIVTEAAFDKDEGFQMTLGIGGLAQQQKSPPAIRIVFGKTLSIVFRGRNSSAKAQIETREDGKWKVGLVLTDCPPLDDKFWTGSHLLRVYQLGGRVIVDLDGIIYHYTMTTGQEPKTRTIVATWPKAPVEVLTRGVEAMFGIDRISGKDKDGKHMEVNFKRTTSGPQRIDIGKEFLLLGPGPFEIPVESDDPDLKKLKGVTAMAVGSDLEELESDGTYHPDGKIAYKVRLKCSDYKAPLLGSLAVTFPPSATLEKPPSINLRPAVTEWQVSGGNPDSSEDTQATFSLSRALLNKFFPGWELAVAPYRPITISMQEAANETPQILFKGWIKPNNFDTNDNADQKIGVVCGDMISERLNQAAGLIDERFGPLDLLLDNTHSAIWGAQCVQYIVGTILGADAYLKFNGTGNPFQYLADGAPPLLDNRQNGAGLAVVLSLPQKGGFYLTPPFGDSAISWINSLAEQDYAITFYDPRTEAIYYGDPILFLEERGKTIYEVSPDQMSQLSNQAEFEQAFNDIRVWGQADNGMEALMPSLLMGRAGDDGRQSLNPISRSQSWTRTLLLKPSFVKIGVVDENYAQQLAYSRWREQEGRVPAKYSLVFETGWRAPQWGELIDVVLPGEDWITTLRILKVTHSGHLSGGGDSRFSTTVEARSLTASGQ